MTPDHSPCTLGQILLTSKFDHATFLEIKTWNQDTKIKMSQRLRTVKHPDWKSGSSDSGGPFIHKMFKPQFYSKNLFVQFQMVWLHSTWKQETQRKPGKVFIYLLLQFFSHIQTLD